MPLARVVFRILPLRSLVAGPIALGQDPNQLIKRTCVACHNEYTLQAGLNLQDFDAEKDVPAHRYCGNIIRKLRAGQMPPREIPRDEADIACLVDTLETEIDHLARDEGRGGARPFQRVNRAEYARLVYDLLGLTIDTAEWLPEDRISASFDNIADAQEMPATLWLD